MDPHELPGHDPARQKILDAAGHIFAENGFQNTTVRDICALAGVNVASVNYYFGDKTALYLEALRQTVGAAKVEIPPDTPPEEALRTIIHAMCQRMLSKERPSWAYRIMAHEMARPTPALDQVIEELIRPAYQRMRNALGAMLQLPPDHATTRMCAHSIIAQVIHYVSSRPVISKVWPELQMTPEQVEMLAEHISDFSLCSVKEFARKGQLTNA
jgi:AcrR family transcriptional regulator